MTIENKRLSLREILESAPQNRNIQYALAKSYEILSEYHNVEVSVSGGSDSDIMLDLLIRTGNKNEMKFIWFNTGLEYKATRNHISFLENKYDIQIERIIPEKSIVMSCREYGTPFLNKAVSELIERLQKNGFEWEDDEYENLIKKYPNCMSSLKWWCNNYPDGSRFNIAYHKYLKEFMMDNNPEFNISNKCCTYAKKKVYLDYVRENNCDLDCSGVRKAERGIRSSAYKDCFSKSEKKSSISGGVARFRPIFWFTDEDKKEYEVAYDVTHSECYTEYGMKRTGCAGCPFNLDLEDDLEILQKHEPTLYKACWNVFRNSYEYRRKYYEYRFEKKRQLMIAKYQEMLARELANDT